MLEAFQELAREQNRTICTLRHMMELGYSILFIADRDSSNLSLPTGRWALCKYPTIRNKDEGVILFDNYDDAWYDVMQLIWTDRDFKKSSDIIYELKDLRSLIRRVY